LEREEVKVNIYETVEVSDEDRAKIAAQIGQKTATREDLKMFIWSYGSNWRDRLDQGEGEPDIAAEDLI
jgi:hypothetical protein